MKKVNKLKQPQQEQKVETIKVKNQKASAELSLIELETKEDLEINDLDSKNKITAFDWNSAKANFETVQNEINEVNTRLNYIQSLLTIMNELSAKQTANILNYVDETIAGTKYRHFPITQIDWSKYKYTIKNEINFGTVLLNIKDGTTSNVSIFDNSAYSDNSDNDYVNGLVLSAASSTSINYKQLGKYGSLNGISRYQKYIQTLQSDNANITITQGYNFRGDILSNGNYTTTAIKEKWAATSAADKTEYEKTWKFLKQNISSYSSANPYLCLPLGNGEDSYTKTMGKYFVIVKGYQVSGDHNNKDSVSIYYIGYAQIVSPGQNTKWLFNGCMTYIAEYAEDTILENTINYFINNYPNYPNGELTFTDNQTILADLLSKEITDQIGFGVIKNNTPWPNYKGLYKNANIWNALAKRDTAWNTKSTKKIKRQEIEYKNDIISL